MSSNLSKSKGSAFERKVCKDLSLWVTGGERSDVFWRSAMSGGRATVSLNAGVQLRNQAGDVSPIAFEGMELIDTFVIECKHYADLKLHKLFFDEYARPMRTFWDKLAREARDFNKDPMLIAKQNHYPTLVCLNNSGLRFLQSRTTIIKPNAISYNASEPMYIISYDTMLKVVLT